MLVPMEKAHMPRGKNGNESRQHAPRQDQDFSEAALLVKVHHRIFDPEQHADRHRDKIEGRVGKEQVRQLHALNDAPEYVQYVIRQHGEQEASVYPLGGLFKRALLIQYHVLIFDQQDQHRQQTDRRIVHTTQPLFALWIKTQSLVSSFV